MKRRQWLKSAGLLAIGAGCRAIPSTSAALAPVNVSDERVIRTTVGLRPFRPAGFRVESESFDRKTVVHNYGHGGGGMSLSWGTAHLAVEKALATGEDRFAVVGCGVMGLSTACRLQNLGKDVTIYSKDIPPETTSNMSAAWWSPGSTVDPGERTEAYDEQFVKAARFANRYYQNYIGDDYGVHWRPRYSVSEQPPDASARSLIADLFPEGRDLAQNEHPFPWPYVQRSWTMVIEPPRYLRSLLRDFRIAGGSVVVRTFDALDDVLALDESVIVNCSGLGARELFGDETLTPIKGQLTFLLPQPEIDYMMVGGGLYMIPRGDGLALGSTHERGEWSLEPSRTEMHRVMEGHSSFWGQMARA
jgi:glycine/D-amino acid oxidase-like deaminating enzyme